MTNTSTFLPMSLIKNKKKYDCRGLLFAGDAMQKC